MEKKISSCHHLRFILPSILVLVCASCGSPDKALDASHQEAESQVSHERLLAQAPPNWQLIYELNNGDTRLSDFIPAGEKSDDWQSKLSFEAHAQLIDMDPISLMIGEIEKRNEICTNLTHANLFSGLENNYPASVRLIMCGENAHTKLGEISLSKAIQGEDFLYIVRFEKKVPVFEQGGTTIEQSVVAQWSSYLRRIQLCNTKDAPDDENSHFCPAAQSNKESNKK